jgi:signal transduction histidine kinase
MAADSDGNAYLLLHVLGNIDFNPEGGGQPYVAQADGDAAVAKFNADGTIGWVKTIKNNGDGFAWGTGLALDDADNAYVSGHYVGTLDFNPEGGGDTRTICTGLGDSGDCGGAFLSSWDSAGTYRWTETTEPSPGGYPTGLALISDLKIVSGEILYAAGLFNGFTDFDPAAGEDSKYGFSYFSTFLPYLSTFLLSNSTTGSGGDVDGDSTINDPPGGSGQNNEPPIPPGPIAEVVGEVPVEAPDLDDFEFDVNLTDGIEVGPGEYKVVVNPPAGSELQLEKVEFYLDGNPTHTATADENGQFVWPWDTTSQPGGTVRVIAYEKNGGTSSKQFFVNVKRTTPPGVAIIQPEEAPPAQEVDTSLLASTERFIKQLPPSLVKSFPYWLFVLLALLALLLFMIAWREAAEVNSIERKLKHDQLLNAQKINFVQLVSHYMRTPVALMRDSASLALALKEGPPAVWQALEKQVASLGQHVEDLLGRVTSIPSVQAPQFAQAPEVRLWKRPSFVVPVVLVGVLAIFTDVLAGLVGDLDISVLNVIGQILVFIIGAAALYMAIRAVTLGRKRRQRLLQAREQEADIDGARNNVLDRSSSLLVPDFGTIKQSSLQVNPGKGANMFAGGVKRFESMLERFDLAKRLGADAPVLHTTELPLRTVLNSATANLRPQIDAKNITIQYPADQTIKTDSDWMVFVLASLIDNAVAYSPQGGTVTIEANDTSISVEDHGSGIEEDKLDFLTQPFARADDVEKFTHEGMGLSLYLDKLVGTQLGYTMDMQSAPERGTKVTLTRVR